MSTVTTAEPDQHVAVGWLGRLGGWAADHRRKVAITWAAVVLCLGAFAPVADRALSGAGWEALGSDSVAARHALDADFGGRDAYALTAVVAGGDNAATVARVEALLRTDRAVAGVETRKGATAVVVGLSGGTPREMVEAAGRLKERLAGLSGQGTTVRLTGPAAMWSDFNETNKAAMLKSEVLSWPLTLALLLLAFGTVWAAGLPLLLTMGGLMGAGGLLFLVGQVADVSIWAMNFAMMFAIALGIDYALFVVVRFRAELAAGREPREAAVVTMETAGRAVLVSGLTVIGAVMALTLIDVPAFRTVPIGIALSVAMVLAGTLTLLPAVLARLGHRINGGRLRVRSAVEHRSHRFGAWANRLWARPFPYAAAAVGILLLLAAPALGLRVGMPTATALPEHADAREGQVLLERAFGPGSASALQIVVPVRDAPAAVEAVERDPGIASTGPTERAGDSALLTAIPRAGTEAATIDRLRNTLPAGAHVGGAAAETRDLEHALTERLPIVVAVALGLGFILLVALLRAPIIAAAAVAMSLLATVAAFGVARLIFQDGVLDGLLGWHAQGFVDAWAPIFFFALIFSLAIDYTVFLLSTVKAERDRTGDDRQALVQGLSATGRVINAAAGVMVVVFLTFALSGPIAPREMGVILAVAVLLDATLIRLLLQPVVLRLLGSRAWWMPRWLDRLVPDLAG
jgi:putative drug exporter of the RND superfamily